VLILSEVFSFMEAFIEGHITQIRTGFAATSVPFRQSSAS
jgi:hypothetical protein